MKILFIYPHIGDGKRRQPNLKRYFPWGFATVMRFVENDGHEVHLLDVYGNDLLPNEVNERLRGQSYECVCISGFASYNYSYVLWLAQQVKRLQGDVPVIIGGILADLHHERLLTKPEIDICVLGEGELTAIELLRSINSIDNVHGLAFKRNGKMVKTQEKALIKDLDSLPLPNFDLWNMEKYLRGNLWADDLTTKYNEFPGNFPSKDNLNPNISVFFGRGCPFSCNFCSRSYQNVRYKTPDKVIKEIIFLKNKFGIKAIHFYDELVVFKRSFILEFCQKIKPLNIYWDCQGRVNTVDEEVMRIMKESNCYSIGFGFESGSNKLLMAMGKGVNREDNLRVLQAAKKTGMHLKIQLMCGYPGETEETIAETVHMMKISQLPPRRMSWTTPLPGSKLYQDSVDNGLIKNEEEYLIRLGRLNMNSPNGIVLNVSGLSDKEMTRLYYRGNAEMECNFIIQQMKNLNFLSKKCWYYYNRLLKAKLALLPLFQTLYRFLRYCYQWVRRLASKKYFHKSSLFFKN
jgi:anaerobic magnesium-protoporphyrin IX monomethyl ester cyclase